MANKDLNADLSKLAIDKSRKRRLGGGLNRFVLLLALAVIFGGGGYFTYAKFATTAVPVEIVRPTRESGAPNTGQAVLTAGGYIVARDVYVISTKIDGRVKDIFIERGDIVKAGDTIITIEDEEYVARVRLAEAQVAKAKANANQLRAGSRPQEIAKARADAASAKASALQAKKEEDRVIGLAREGIASSSELDMAKANRAVAKANHTALVELLRLAELGPRIEEIQMADAQLLEMKANLEYAQTQLSYTTIRSPIAGTILEKVAKKGEMVTTNTFGGAQGARSAAVTMADLTDLQVELDINEDDLPRVRAQQKCELRVDSHPEDIILGIVDEIAPRANRQKATVQVKVKILDPPPFLRPEVNARVTFLEEATKEVVQTEENFNLWVPRRAVVLGLSGSVVYVVHEGKALQRSVKTGREGPQGVEITEGLVGDERIVASNLDRMADGLSITEAKSR
jgi:HlyD family secretion protein